MHRHEIFVHRRALLRLGVEYSETAQFAKPAGELPRQLRATSLEWLIGMALLEKESATTENIYADGFILNDNRRSFRAGESMVWTDLERWFHGDGVVGITEQMSESANGP